MCALHIRSLSCVRARGPSLDCSSARVRVRAFARVRACGRVCVLMDPQVTILFSDIVDYTALAAAISNEQLVSILNEMFVRSSSPTPSNVVFC